MKNYIVAFFVFLLAGCAGAPRGAVPVTEFDVNRYLGTWNEVARLDHRFERGLVEVTAEYALRPDGGVSVLNRGYSTARKEWKTTEGRAYFRGDRNTGALKVTFFWPFYGGYNIIDLADDYSYALVAGPSTKYLWILSRTPELPENVLARLKEKAKGLGFPVEQLIFPGQVQDAR